MPIGIGSALWAVTIPIEETNLCTNPSYEFNSTGAAAIQSATLGTTSQFQRYGAWSLKVTPNSNGTSGAVLGTWTSGNGTTYSVSAWAFVESGVPMRLAVGDGNGVNLTSGSVTFTGGGTWHWYNTGIIEAAGPINRALVLQKTSGNSQLPFYVDGVKISPWTDSLDRVTTYIDGDQPGGTWLGAQHASASYRPSQVRSGGSIIALADLGLSPDQYPGAGMPPIDVSTQSYAVTDGAEFQRQRAAQRAFTLTSKPIVGTSLADFHVTRRTLIDVFKPDLVTPQQPIRFLYYGGQGTIGIDAYYDKGLELGRMDGPIAEDAAITFLAADPYWYAPTQQGTTLAPRTSLGSIKFIANRDSLGRWGTMGPSGSALDNAANAIVPGQNGLVYVGGAFGSAAGTRARFVASWNPTTGGWGTLVGGTLNGEVRELLQYSNGNIYAAGLFSSAAGTTANAIALYNVTGQAWGTLNGGGVNSGGKLFAMAIGYDGQIYAGGTITQAAGTTANQIAQYNPFTDRWGTMTTGLQNSDANNIPVNDIAVGLDANIYVTGNYGTAGGTFANDIAFWNPTSANWGTMTTGLQIGGIAGDARGERLAVAPSGNLYIGGNFGSAGGGSAAYFAVWNGVQFAPAVGSLNNSVSAIYAASSGEIGFGGAFTQAGGVSIPGRSAKLMGGAVIPLDIAASISIQTFIPAPDGTLYVGFAAAGTAQVASVAQVVNAGRTTAYPILRLRNLSTSGTARIFQFLNTTTGAGLYFNYAIQPSEEVTLVTAPGERSLQSNLRGNILGRMLPGSNLATFNLQSGTNHLSFFSDNDSLEAAVYWQPRGWSIDSGTVL